MWWNKKIIYMDYASTTPVSIRVFKAMRPFWQEVFYNASGLYPKARLAKKALEQARTKVAKVLHGKPEEIIFVSGGTESVNLALFGTLNIAKEKGISKPEIISSTIEHPAIFEALKMFEKENLAKVIYISPNEEGIISPKKVAEAINESTVLVTIGYVNNEIGVIQDIANIGSLITSYRKKKRSLFPLFHTDACQAANYLNLNRDVLKVDLLSLDGSKIYGPKGVGILYVKNGISISPVFYGGGQEKGLRPGTEPVALIAGFAEALEETNEMKDSETKRLRILQEYFFTKIREKIPQAEIIGSIETRVPNNVHICISGMNSEFAAIALGEEGVCVSPMTACSNLDELPVSKVLLALGKKDCASSSLRFSLGRGTSKSDIDKVISILPRIIENSCTASVS